MKIRRNFRRMLSPFTTTWNASQPPMASFVSKLSDCSSPLTVFFAATIFAVEFLLTHLSETDRGYSQLFKYVLLRPISLEWKQHFNLYTHNTIYRWCAPMWPRLERRIIPGCNALMSSPARISSDFKLINCSSWYALLGWPLTKKEFWRTAQLSPFLIVVKHSQWWYDVSVKTFLDQPPLPPWALNQSWRNIGTPCKTVMVKDPRFLRTSILW